MANPRDKLHNIPRAARAIPNIPSKTYEKKAVKASKTTGRTVDKFPRASP